MPAKHKRVLQSIGFLQQLIRHGFQSDRVGHCREFVREAQNLDAIRKEWLCLGYCACHR